MGQKLTSPSIVREILKKFGFKFSKSLGQNFLIDENILNKIIKTARVNENDYILEIGAGIGTLTQQLACRAKKVVAVEIDKNLMPILNYTLADYTNVSIINKDILKTDIYCIIKDEFEGHSFKVVANLPYYITSPIVMKLLEGGYDIDSITVMMQKEVADRLNAQPGSRDYGVVSVAVQCYACVDIVCIVPPTVFMPKPKVDSALVILDLLTEPLIPMHERRDFFKIVRACFSQRRKTIVNSLYSSNFLGMDKEQIRQALLQAGIRPDRRAETISINEFKSMLQQFKMYQ